MSIVTKVTAAGNGFAHVQLEWSEPGHHGASLTFDVTVQTFLNQPAKDIEKIAVIEATRAANAFLGFCAKGIAQNA